MADQHLQNMAEAGEKANSRVGITFGSLLQRSCEEFITAVPGQYGNDVRPLQHRRSLQTTRHAGHPPLEMVSLIPLTTLSTSLLT